MASLMSNVFVKQEILDAAEVAITLAKTTGCDRAGVGCVLMDINHRLISVGVNHSPAPRVCQRPNEMGNCGCLHAEVVAAIRLRAGTPRIAVVTAAPCERCAKVLVDVGVQQVYYIKDSRPQEEGFVVFNAGGVSYCKLDANVGVITP